jgi:CheY-like chemotaxis protein
MRPTLLYVEDKPERLSSMTTILERLGYDVLAASSGREAIDLFRSHSVQLSIIDYSMPGMMGDAVAHEIKRLEPTAPVLIFSGMLSLPDRVMAMVDGFISTSEEPEVLLDKIAELLPLRRAQAS